MVDATNLFNFDTSIDWEIQESPVYDAGGQEVPGFKLLVNDQTNQVINIARQSYKPITNSQLLHLSTQLTGMAPFSIEGYVTFDGGKKVLVYLKHEDKVELAGVPSANYLIVGNSHDYSTSFFSGFTNRIFRCENMFTSMNQQIRIFHRKNEVERIDEIPAIIDLYYDKERDLYDTLESFARVKVKSGEAGNIANYLLDIEEEETVSTRKKNKRTDLLKSIELEMGELGNNLFGLYNGVTHYTTHELKPKKQLFGSPFGQAAVMNKRAFNKCLEMREGRDETTSIMVY